MCVLVSCTDLATRSKRTAGEDTSSPLAPSLPTLICGSTSPLTGPTLTADFMLGGPEATRNTGRMLVARRRESKEKSLKAD